MKKVIFFALLVLTPLFTLAAPDRYSEIHGVWEDYYSGISLRIKSGKRNGILVKRLDRSYNSRWRRYDLVGRRTFDDCDGNRIRLSRNGLVWDRRNSRRPIYLERQRDRYSLRRGGGSYCPVPRSNYYSNRSRDRGYDLSGRWYCSEYNMDIDVRYFDEGIRVRRFDDRRSRNENWYEYRRDSRNPNRYYGRNNKYYEWRDDILTFYDSGKKRIIRFLRR